MPFVLSAAFVFAIGAVIGSFLNVVIHRYPREESLAFPPSHCPHCNAGIRWFDNVPILSYLVLLGRCRSCRAAISPRYPLVELANALFYLAVYQRTGPTIVFVPVAAIISMTIALIYIDLEIQILPDVIDLPGIAIGLGIGALRLGDASLGLMLAPSLLDSVAGAVLGAGILLTIALLYKLLRKIEGMGLGDVKMLAMIGAVSGWEAVFAVLLLASITGAIVGLFVAARSKEGLRVAIPFGVFLGLAALAILFFGPTLTAWWADALLLD